MLVLTLLLAVFAPAVTGSVPSSLNLGGGFNTLQNIVHPVMGSSSDGAVVLAPYDVIDVPGSQIVLECPALTVIQTSYEISKSSSSGMSTAFGQGVEASGGLPVPSVGDVSGSFSAEYEDTVSKTSSSSFTATATDESSKWMGAKVQKVKLNAQFTTELVALPAAAADDFATILAHVKVNWELHYIRILNNFGTHVVMEATAGHLFQITSTTSSGSFTSEETSSYSYGIGIDVGGLGGAYSETGSTASSLAEAQSSGSNTCFLYGSASAPQALTYQLVPLYQLVPPENNDVQDEIRVAIAWYVASQTVQTHAGIWGSVLNPRRLSMDLVSLEPASANNAYYAIAHRTAASCYILQEDDSCPQGYGKIADGFTQHPADCSGAGTNYFDQCVLSHCMVPSASAWVLDMEGVTQIDMPIWGGTTGIEEWAAFPDQTGVLFTRYKHAQYDAYKVEFSDYTLATYASVMPEGYGADFDPYSGFLVRESCRHASDPLRDASRDAVALEIYNDLGSTGLPPSFMSDSESSSETGNECVAPTNVNTFCPSGANTLVLSLWLSLATFALLF